MNLTMQEYAEKKKQITKMFREAFPFQADEVFDQFAGFIVSNSEEFAKIIINRSPDKKEYPYNTFGLEEYSNIEDMGQG